MKDIPSTVCSTRASFILRISKCEYCGLLGRCEALPRVLEYLMYIIGRTNLKAVSLVPCRHGQNQFHSQCVG
jgi:hypothetical protein